MPTTFTRYRIVGGSAGEVCAASNHGTTSSTSANPAAASRASRELRQRWGRSIRAPI